MDQDPTYDRRASEALAVTLGTGDKTKLTSKALYGPARWPVGRPRDARSKLLTGVVAANERVLVARRALVPAPPRPFPGGAKGDQLVRTQRTAR